MDIKESIAVFKKALGLRKYVSCQSDPLPRNCTNARHDFEMLTFRQAQRQWEQIDTHIRPHQALGVLVY